MEKEEFYTAQEVADILKVNIVTVYRYIKAGKLVAYKFGKEFRIENNDFKNFLKRMTYKEDS